MQEKEKLFNKNDYLTKYNLDMLAILSALSVAGVYLNGISALKQIVICTLTAVLSELFFFKAVMKKSTLGDLSAFVTGLTIALMLPASAPYYVGVLGCIFAVAVAKLPFGNAKNVPFVPSAAAFCFLAALMPDKVFYYGENTVTLTDMISSSEGVSLDIFGRTALLSGAYGGAIGTGSVLVFAGAVVFLLIRQRKRLYAPFGFLLTVAVLAFIFPRVNSGRISSVITELCAGSLLFAAFVILTDPVTVPKNKKYALCYGALAGVITVLLRAFSNTVDPCFFAVLCVNALRPLLLSKKVTHKKLSVNTMGGAKR